jgi:polysaccharide biosynthesis protein PslH
MRCLWVTRLVPYPPFRGGDAIYTARLIESLAAAGAEVTVLTHDNDGEPAPETPGVRWVVAPFRDRARIASLAVRAPSLVHRFSTPEIRRAFSKLVREQVWDAILIDNLAMAGTVDLGPTAGDASYNAALVYVSHNHEESLRRQLAAGAPRRSLRRLALHLDAWKSASLERRLVEVVDLVTVNTAVDADLYRQVSAGQRYLELTPGYTGLRVEHRSIDLRTPRRVMLLGSYGWVAKQLNLLRFLRIAAAPLAHAGVGIDVVGWAPDGFIERLRADFPTVTVIGPVEQVAPYLLGARIGVVAEEIGGGFKHKVLDYVFNRLPVAALANSVAGVPLVRGKSILEFPDLDQLTQGILNAIDDVATLDASQEAAFDACDGRFDWADRGQALADTLARLRPQVARSER